MLIYHPYFCGINDTKDKYRLLRRELEKKERLNLLNDFQCIKQYVWKGNILTPEITKIVVFINEKISTKLDIIEDTTLQVYVRIVTSMINKLEDTGKISQKQNILIWESFINNLYEARTEWFNWRNENIYHLPF